MSPRPTKLATARSLALWVGCDKQWLLREAEAGRLPHVNAGGRILFDPEAVEEALIERARKANQASGRCTNNG